MRRLALLVLLAAPAGAEEARVSPVRDPAVTIYRAPQREGGSINLDFLQGFALISETRTVSIPAGQSKLRFEGVADGIQPASAIVTGLPSGVIEKTRDAQLLSPGALIDAALGSQVTLVRTNRQTGKVSRLPATIRSGPDGGVLFETAEGVEALRCSGLPETFTFDRVPAGLSAVPTLSVLTRNDRPVTATVTLSYLARGFDWAADYVATMSADGRTLDLGAWVTLANGNGIGFADAAAQVVAGRLNREEDDTQAPPRAEELIAYCWPLGTTSDVGSGGVPPPPAPPPPIMAPLAMTERAMDIVVTARKRVELEQLGDLKLYRVPDRTTIAARQSKQVRLLDRAGVPVARIYTAELGAADNRDPFAARIMLRTRNDAKNRLGLPLPSGRIAVFETARGRPMLFGETNIRDTAVGEEVEIVVGEVPDVQVRQTTLERKGRRSGVTVEISNARSAPIDFELRLYVDDGATVADPDQPMARKDGRPIFRLKIPANGSKTVRYAVESARSPAR